MATADPAPKNTVPAEVLLKQIPLIAVSLGAGEIGRNIAPILKALSACDSANKGNESRHYILNDTGQEYFNGTWID